MSKKVCAIVGFGSGVSMGVARAFAKEGFALALVARSPSNLTNNAQTLKEDGYSVLTFAADAGDEASLVQAFTQIRTELSDPEVLIYNAAAFTPGKPSSISLEALVADFRVNVAGALVAAQQVIPAMKANGKGTILLTGGGLALHPFAEAASLSIGKAGIRSLAFTLAQELKASGIHVGTVTICGTVQSGTHFDPDLIAPSYLTLHKQSQAAFETEVIYQ
ncbi:MAG: SDR family NAD(P)-dependent oxidoreductase [Anaerolineae bacterium]|nr:SDR family NAD(P)-dependent oxidoreductase [Gloeobacterales cyanobacterium ES-bin-313]